MRCKISALTLLAWTGIAFAQRPPDLKALHDRDDQQWARKSGLSVNDVREIRILAGIADATDGAVIKHIDATSLKQRNHILFAEAGNGHCMRLHVFERTAGAFREVWSLSDMPGPDWPIGATASSSGRGICQQGPRSPSVHATSEGRIVLEVPILSDPFQRTVPAATFSFAWDGSKYIRLDDDR